MSMRSKRETNSLNREKIYFAPAGKETKLEPSDCLNLINDLKTLPFEFFDEVVTETNAIDVHDSF